MHIVNSAFLAATLLLPLAPSSIDPSGAAKGLKAWVVRPNGVARMPLAGGLSATDMTTFRMHYPADFVVDRTPH
jgi:hypothetical protein